MVAAMPTTNPWIPEDLDGDNHLDYDPFEDDEEEERPKRRKLTDGERAVQTLQRQQLFHTGSQFKHTSRNEIVGIDNIMGEIDEIIHWLCHSEDYARHKSRLQPGVLFSGSPGTGKTLVSRWIATASDALFVNVRDFAHQHALFTDADIQELFTLARSAYTRTKKPIVLFWDEFENAAIERGGDRATPEQKSVVSQLTAELDGIHGKNEGILLIGCTNYAGSIDTALLRRGRMGVHIEFHAPDRAGKEKILTYYLGQMVCEPDIDFHTLSYFFPKHNTAADIEEACVEAWRHAVRRSIDTGGNPHLNDKDLVKVFIKQLVGPPTTFTLPDDEKMPIAIHECGHAIAALAFNVPLRLITVQPGKRSLGRVMVDDPKEYIGNINEMMNYMRMSLGGVAGERTAGLPAMTGSTSDIHKVTETAEFLVSSLKGGKRTGIFNYSALGRSAGYTSMSPQVSQIVLERADQDVLDLIIQVEQDAYDCLDRVGKDNLFKIAEKVNEKVTMTGKEFLQLFIEICEYDPTR